MSFRSDLDDNLSVTHVFMKQIFKAAEQGPSFLLPHTGLFREVGEGILALFIL
jgi:hypothetical protein